MKRIVITGALGQIGTELTDYLRRIYGEDQVIATSRSEKDHQLVNEGIFEVLDVTDPRSIHEVLQKHKPDTIIHLAAILSARGEGNPQMLWNINMNGLYNILEAARESGAAIFTPSSIAAFGPETPPVLTPQDTIQRPQTIYGVSKVAGELLCDYYFHKYGVDTRGIRFPGLISNAALPGGGTTDYAVHIYYAALREKRFTCNIKAGTFMDMMYLPDALRAIVQLMEADPGWLKHRNAFNTSAMSFDPEGIRAAIQKYIPEFTMDYDVDPIKQEIAESWPDRLDDSAARNEWGFKPEYDLDHMTLDMLETLSKKLNVPLKAVK